MSVVDTIWGHIWSKHRKLTLFLSIEWVFLIIYGILSYLYMGQLIQLMINQSLVMSPKSDLFKLWKDPPVQPELRSDHLISFWHNKPQTTGCDGNFVLLYTYTQGTLKANVSQEILNWHSLRQSHSAEICIHFYCLS